MSKKSYPLGKVYGLLETGPVCLITTARKGQANVMTQSWHTMMEFEPPLVGCVFGGQSLSSETLTATRECVINIPTEELAKQVVGVGNCSGRKVDKFKKFGLTPRPAKLVQAPLLDECFASLECRVADSRLANKYGFFVLEVVQAWVDTSVKLPRTLHHRGNGVFAIAGENIKLPSKMK
ncbi:MAG TPA: flavin reductase family protein [Gallionellaceae bacterium]